MSSLAFISPNGVFQCDVKKYYTTHLRMEHNMIEFCGTDFNGDTVARDNVYIGNEDDSIDMTSINIEYLKAVNQVKYSKKRGLVVVNITKYVDKNYDKKNDLLLESLSSDICEDINSCAKNMVDTFLNVALFAMDNVEIRKEPSEIKKETSEPEKESETPMDEEEDEEETPNQILLF
jgi:hypothetical protein